MEQFSPLTLLLPNGTVEYMGIQLSPNQISERGQKIYQEKLKPILEPSQNGKFAAIEVEVGEYFLGDTVLEVLEKAKKSFPQSIFYTVRVGYDGVYKMATTLKKDFFLWMEFLMG